MTARTWMMAAAALTAPAMGAGNPQVTRFSTSPVGVAAVPPGARADADAGQRAQAEHHDFPLAITLFTRAIAAAPAFADAYAGRGITYYQMDDLAKAAQDLSTAIQLGVSSAGAKPVYSMLGIVYRRQNRAGDAVRIYTAYLQRARNWDVLMQRGEAYQLAKDYTRARADFAQALDLSPSNPKVVQDVALLDLQSAAWPSAVADSALLLTIRPDDPDAIRLHEMALRKAREQRVALDAPSTVDAGPARSPYGQAVDRLRRGDLGADFAALRREMASQPGYRADRWLAAGSASAALSGGDPKTALIVAEQRLADDYLDIGAHEIAYLALKALARPVEASRHITIAGGLIRSILGSGDGRTLATAWTVVSTDEEYAVLGVKRVSKTQQALIDAPGHKYDRLDVADQAGAKSPIWFNIDAYYGKE